MIGNVHFQPGSGLPHTTQSLYSVQRRSAKMNANQTRPRTRRTKGLHAGCYFTCSITLFISGGIVLMIGVSGAMDIGNAIYKSVAIVLLALALLAFVVGIIRLIYHRETGRGGSVVPPATVRPGHENGQAMTNLGRLDDGTRDEAFLANQSRLDLPPSYRSSRLFVSIESGLNEEEDEEVAISPPPSYVDICKADDAPPYREENQSSASLDPS